MMHRFGAAVLALLTVIGNGNAMNDDVFQHRMNIAAADLAMLNMGGRALVKQLEACRTEHPDWDDGAIDAYRTRVSAELRARMEEFLKMVLQDETADIADIRALQREHREQLESEIPREILARVVHSGAYVIDQVDWTCKS